MWKQFVQSHVNDIRKLVSREHWSHYPDQKNPEDIPSSGLTTTELAVSKLWRSCPEWLKDEEIDIDCDQQVLVMPTECTAELKVKDKKMVHGLLNCQSPTPANLESIICGE